MKNLLNPKWLLIINTLPISILLFLYMGQFNIIKTLLNENNVQYWIYLGISLVILGTGNLAYTIYLIAKNQKVSTRYSVFVLLCYIPFIYWYAYNLHEIMPFSIPEWMISGNMFLYAGTFLMPTLAYALFVIVTHFTSEDKEHKAWVNFLMALGIPISAYLFTQLILPLWQRVESDFFLHALVVINIAGVLIFFFFLVRGVYILTSNKKEVWLKYQLAWKLPIAIILPLLGLAVNNGELFDHFGAGSYGIFGDFHNSWFYILAMINGLLVCSPSPENIQCRLLLYIGRCITFAYTLYFFLVFLPFLPVSVIAIIAIGTGFLMLAPLLLFTIHINELSKDFTVLKTKFSKNVLIGISILSFLVIPVCITSTYMKDKTVLNKTLSYLYSPDYSKQYDIDKSSLQKTLHVIKTHKDRRSGGGIFGNGIPYLSSYFKWIVLDNLTLSDTKINTIGKVFFDAPSLSPRSENILNHDVGIQKISTRSSYDEAQAAWRSWIDLEIINSSELNRFVEYATTIDLPEGCWISDYYLYVGDKKESGILSEKKSAMWIFSQIRNENRDPGILYYLTGNKVAFRVFPFSKNEVRKTGIEFLHKEPISISLDDNVVELGNFEDTIYENSETENVVYITAQKKQSLDVIKRKPYFHFLVDVSKEKYKYSADFINRIDEVLANHEALSENAQISFVNSYVNSIPLNKEWQSVYNNQSFAGGFYLDRAIKTTLVNAHLSNSTSYPIIVVVTDSIAEAVLDKDYSDLKFTFPESHIFYNLDSTGRLMEHSLIHNPKQPLPKSNPDCRFCETVLEYRGSNGSVAYIPDNDEPSIILKKDMFTVSETEIKEKDWLSALTMHGHWMTQNLYPEKSDNEWLNLVKLSFMTRIMTPVTSYLVVENEAQKAMLKKKQKQVLSGNKSLDPGEDIQRMSEPGFVWLTIFLGIFLWHRRKRYRIWTKLE